MGIMENKMETITMGYIGYIGIIQLFLRHHERHVEGGWI